MKYPFLFVLLISTLSTAFSQTLTVLDSVTGGPVETVVLMSTQPRAFASTNAKGQTSIAAFRGSEMVELRVLGYKTQYMSYAEMEALDFTISLKPTSVNLDQVIVSANRWNQTSSNVASRIVSITPREVQLQNPQTAADLLGLSGKVFIQKSQQGGGSPMIRGFATNRLIYTVDGVRMNTAIFRGGNIQNVINLDPFVMEYTEVLFGPGSVMYGSDAIGGVMSFKTIDAELSLNDLAYIKGKAVTRYASANMMK
jgi:hemoglobin/transferrin/lactoferrin receptor protein